MDQSMKKQLKLSGLWYAAYYICIAAAVFILELILRNRCELPIIFDGIPVCVCYSAAFTMLICLLSHLLGSKKARAIVSVLFVELLAIWFTVSYFTENSYKVFMTPGMVTAGAGDVLSDFSAQLKAIMTNGLGTILLFQLPVFAVLICGIVFPPEPVRRNVKYACLFVALCAAFVLLGNTASVRTELLEAKYKSEYVYDDAVRYFGLMQGTCLELRYHTGSSAADEEIDFSTPEQAQEVVEQPETVEISYDPNVMDLDMEELIANSSGNVKSLHQYVASKAPTSKNQYTGIFKGKNLILITAEAFSKEVIDPERTPALYRLANKGIVFEDFYQPAWGGSTSTGEYSWLVGLVPREPGSMLMSQGNNLYFTMGNQLQRQNYFSIAYHDGAYTYYNRNETHENLGYSSFIGIGNGLEAGVNPSLFPSSDLEMMEYTIEQYIDCQPFSVYYMSISGHAAYAFSDSVNDMSVKNEAITEKMSYTESVRAYYACNQEFEYALEYLLERLEEEGIAEDTVIAIVPDHYPYGLRSSTAWGISEDDLCELYGVDEISDYLIRDHNAAIIWCGSLENEDPIVVSDPVSSLDILPTLSNLFGLEYDSRMLVGRDILSEAEPLVFWNNYYWLTDKGFYNSSERTFYPNEGVEENEAYVERIKQTVSDKLLFSGAVLETDYYGKIFGKDTIQ